MSKRPVWQRHWLGWLTFACLALLGTGAALAGVGALFELSRLERDLASADAVVRARAVEYVSSRREDRALASLIAMFEREQDAELIQKAGKAILRLNDPAGIAALQRKADACPDGITRAWLIVYAAELAACDVRLIEWLERGAASPEPWQAIGSAVGLVELARPEGGPLTIELLHRMPPDAKRWGLDRFGRIANFACQALGQPAVWWACGSEPDEANLQRLNAFWQDRVDPRLLYRVLQRVRNDDRQWADIIRLLHARSRVAQWFE